jgi:hypothetical protein
MCILHGKLFSSYTPVHIVSYICTLVYFPKVFVLYMLLYTLI